MSIVEQSSGRHSPQRGDIPQAECMQTLQIAYLHAVAASAGCSLQPHQQDYRGIDWEVTHGDPRHSSEESEATVKVQLKATHQITQPPTGDHFPFTIKNKHLKRLNYANPSVHRILAVMLVPADMSEWIAVDQLRSELRYCCYWANLSGVQITGREKTTVHIPSAQILDDKALCDIMARVGSGGSP
jgi:hypothetical protein